MFREPYKKLTLRLSAGTESGYGCCAYGCEGQFC